MNERKRIGMNEAVVVQLKGEVAESFPFPSLRYLAVYVEENRRPVLYLFTEDFISKNVSVVGTNTGVNFTTAFDVLPLGSYFQKNMMDGVFYSVPYSAGQFSRARARALYLKDEWFSLPIPHLTKWLLFKYWISAPFRRFCK